MGSDGSLTLSQQSTSELYPDSAKSNPCSKLVSYRNGRVYIQDVSGESINSSICT
jgi:hypothetical protein